MSRTLKISTIQEAEDYINRQNRQISNLQFQLSIVEEKAKNEARAEAARRIDQMQAEMQQLERQLTSQLNEMDTEMRNNYLEHRRMLREQEQNFNNQFSQLKDWTAQEINNLREDVKRQFNEQQKQIDSNRKSIESILRNQQRNVEQAQIRLNNLLQLLNIIDKNNNHEKYAPGQLDKIRRRIRTLQYPKIPAESIIAQTLNITNDLYDLEEEIIKERLIFDAKYNLTLEKAEELIKIMQKNRNDLYFTDENGEEIKDEEGNKFKIEVDYWTNGKYSDIEGQVKKLEKELVENKDKVELDNERLDQILKKIQDLKTQQEELVILATRRGLASEARVRISEEIINAFMKQGYWLKDGIESHNYMGSEKESTDMREGVVAVLKNGIGTEITLIIQPSEDGTKNNIVFHRNDDNELTQVEYMRTLNEIKEIINEGGYKMEEPKIPEKIGDKKIEDLVDISALKKTGLSDVLKNKLFSR